MFSYILNFILICVSLYLAIELNRWKNKYEQHVVDCDFQKDIFKNETLQRDHEKNTLAEIKKNFLENIQVIMSSVLAIKKAIVLSKANIQPLTKNIQSTNNNLVLNFTSIVEQINNAMNEVMEVTVATQRKIVSQSDHDASGENSTFKQEDFIMIVQNRYDKLLQQIIDELMLTRNSKAEDIARLDEIYQNMKRIQSFSDEVTEIASGIELISLNASIEAAKAGEHGRTFAVVAGEVGKMATLSEITAKMIKKELKNTNDSIKTSIFTIKEAMEAETKYINSTVAIIKDLFQSITHSLFQLNKTLLISMGSSTEIKKSVESTINALQLEYISTFLSVELSQFLETALSSIKEIHMIIPVLGEIDNSLNERLEKYKQEFDFIDTLVQAPASFETKKASKDDVTFF